MEATIARLNIEHYRNLLKDETDEAKRQVLYSLMAEEEQKLARLETKQHDAGDSRDYSGSGERSQHLRQ